MVFFSCRGLDLYLADVTDRCTSLPPLFHAPFPTKGRPRPLTHGFKTKGLRIRSGRRKRPSISTPFNRNKDQLADINLALLRHKIFLSDLLSLLPLPHEPTALTESPRSLLKTTLSVTRLSIRSTRVIIINIIIHIITVLNDPHLHRSAHRIIPGIHLKFYPTLPP